MAAHVFALSKSTARRAKTRLNIDTSSTADFRLFAKGEIYFCSALEFSGVCQYYNASFFSRPLTRSLPPRDSADPDRRLNNPEQVPGMIERYTAAITGAEGKAGA
eukprot:gene30438-37750_t